MNILKLLRRITNNNTWSFTDGPDSGMGTDYWFADSADNEAYANNDQGYITISVNGVPIWDNADKFM